MKKLLLASFFALIALSANAQQIVSGFDPGPLWVTATPNSSSHAAGTSVGGLLKIPFGRGGPTPAPPATTALGYSGIITQFAWISTGGATTQLVVRLWAKNPVNTTCTDQTAFAGSATDNKYLITPPFSITPAAPASTTGDSNTYASITGITYDFQNYDTPQTIYIYACVVTAATDTADESSPIYAMASGPQN